MRGTARLLALAAVACATLGGTRALGAPSVSLRVALRPDRLGAQGALTIALRLADTATTLPPPLRSMVVHLPRGLEVHLDGVATCRAASLRRRGAAGCPAAARVGAGHATLEVHAGSQTIPEGSRLTAFRGPSIGGRPSLEILGQGSTPLEQRSVSTGVLRAQAAPYGSRLTISVPPIPTLELEPDASIVSFSLTMGAGNGAATIVVPRRCPAGGFPFAAELGFAGGSRARASTSVRCP